MSGRCPTFCHLSGGFPLAAVHSQINPITKLLMILLRVAIGWHLLYEGYTKITSVYEDKKPFSSEMYLRNSTGPLRFYFRGLVDDFHGLAMLDPEHVLPIWRNYVDRQIVVGALSADARERLETELESLERNLRGYIDEKADEIEAYRQATAEWEKKEQRSLEQGLNIDPEEEFLKDRLPTFEWQVHKKEQAELDKRRAQLTGPVRQWSDELVAAVAREHRAKKSGSLESAGPQTMASLPAEAPRIVFQPNLQQVNQTTMWGLAICGGLMIVGLFTRTACLGAAVFLGLFYLSMPPWPGLDPAPIAEGTYLIVNKNLIELIACLMLASSSVGIWGGLDSLVRGMITRPLFGVGKREVIPRDGD